MHSSLPSAKVWPLWPKKDLLWVPATPPTQHWAAGTWVKYVLNHTVMLRTWQRQSTGQTVGHRLHMSLKDVRWELVYNVQVWRYNMSWNLSRALEGRTWVVEKGFIGHSLTEGELGSWQHVDDSIKLVNWKGFNKDDICPGGAEA